MYEYNIARIHPDGRSVSSAVHSASSAKEALEIYANTTFAQHVHKLIHPGSTFVATRVELGHGGLYRVAYTDVAVCKIQKIVSPTYKIVSI